MTLPFIFRKFAIACEHLCAHNRLGMPLTSMDFWCYAGVQKLCAYRVEAMKLIGVYETFFLAYIYNCIAILQSRHVGSVVGPVNDQYRVTEHNAIMFNDYYPNPIHLGLLFCMHSYFFHHISDYKVKILSRALRTRYLIKMVFVKLNFLVIPPTFLAYYPLVIYSSTFTTPIRFASIPASNYITGLDLKWVCIRRLGL